MIISLLITAISYMIFPIVKYKVIQKNKQFTKDNIEGVLVLNSFTVAILWFLIAGIIYGFNDTVNAYTNSLIKEIFIPIIYYEINKFIFCRKKESINKKTNFENNKLKKIITTKKIAIIIAILLFLNLVVITCLLVNFLTTNNYKEKYHFLKEKYSSVEKLCDGKNFILKDKSVGIYDANTSNNYNGNNAWLICDEKN